VIKRWFFSNYAISENLIEDELKFVNIELPRKTSMFAVGNNQIYELLQFSEKHRSWFLDETVCSNGKIYLTTKIDPLFVFIQLLDRDCKTRAQPLDQVMAGSAGIFIPVLKMDQMRLVSDQKGPDDLKAFIFNETKTLKWLKKKFSLIQNSLRKQKIITSGAASMNFVQSSLDSNDEEAITEAALGIISEYISLELMEKLDQFYGISEKSSHPIAQKRKSDALSKEPDSKKIKVEGQENLLTESNQAAKVQPPKQTSKTKAFEKAAKHTKSISSFFTKK